MHISRTARCFGMAADLTVEFNKYCCYLIAELIFLFPGFQYYEDISKPVSKAEAEAVGQIIEEIASFFSPDVTITLAGGFRR